MRVIYVDDEKIQLKNFRLTVEDMDEITSLEVFDNSRDALLWAQEHPVDIAFLDIDMPHMKGTELARKLKALNRKISIIFVTAYDQYALEAFDIKAVGYLLKPYSRGDIEKEIENICFLNGERKTREIYITTMPDFLVTVGGKNIFKGHSKQEELFALLVDRGKTGITKGDAIGSLSDGKSLSDSAYWSWLFRLKNILEEAGIADIVVTNGNTKYLDMDRVDCDLYRMQNGDEEIIEKYAGKYLERYAWAEERIAELDTIKENYLVKKRNMQ